MKVIWAHSAKMARVAVVQYLLDEFGRKSAIIPVGSRNKIVYRVLENKIHIDDIWDTRREPKKQADNTK